jgi:hypothetical protein
MKTDRVTVLIHIKILLKDILQFITFKYIICYKFGTLSTMVITGIFIYFLGNFLY